MNTEPCVKAHRRTGCPYCERDAALQAAEGLRDAMKVKDEALCEAIDHIVKGYALEGVTDLCTTTTGDECVAICRAALSPVVRETLDSSAAPQPPAERWRLYL